MKGATNKAMKILDPVLDKLKEVIPPFPEIEQVKAEMERLKSKNKEYVEKLNRYKTLFD